VQTETSVISSSSLMN